MKIAEHISHYNSNNIDHLLIRLCSFVAIFDFGNLDALWLSPCPNSDRVVKNGQCLRDVLWSALKSQFTRRSMNCRPVAQHLNHCKHLARYHNYQKPVGLQIPLPQTCSPSQWITASSQRNFLYMNVAAVINDMFFTRQSQGANNYRIGLHRSAAFTRNLVTSCSCIF